MTAVAPDLPRVSLLPLYLPTLACSMGTMGFVAAAGGLCWVRSASTWGRLSDRIGRRRVLLAAVACFALSFAALCAVLQAGVSGWIASGAVLGGMIAARLAMGRSIRPFRLPGTRSPPTAMRPRPARARWGGSGPLRRGAPLRTCGVAIAVSASPVLPLALLGVLPLAALAFMALRLPDAPALTGAAPDVAAAPLGRRLRRPVAAAFAGMVAVTIAQIVVGMTRVLIALAAGSILAGSASITEAGDLSLVLDRRAGAVELYIAGPAPRVLELLGEPAAGDFGAIDPDRWRLEGSFDFGDALIAGTTARIGGEPARFEAMSAMVHPDAYPLPLRSPLDGMIAIAVCTAPEAGEGPALDESRLYLGYIAYAANTAGEIELVFAAPLTEAQSIAVRDHADGQFLAGYRVDLAQGSARLPLRAAPEGLPPPAWLALGALLFNAVFAGGAIVRSRRGGNAQAPHDAISGI